MDKQFQIGERYYFPLHGVGVVSGVEGGVIKVDFRGIVAYLDRVGRPARSGGGFLDGARHGVGRGDAWRG